MSNANYLFRYPLLEDKELRDIIVLGYHSLSNFCRHGKSEGIGKVMLAIAKDPD